MPGVVGASAAGAALPLLVVVFVVSGTRIPIAECQLNKAEGVLLYGEQGTEQQSSELCGAGNCGQRYRVAKPNGTVLLMKLKSAQVKFPVCDVNAGRYARLEFSGDGHRKKRRQDDATRADVDVQIGPHFATRNVEADGIAVPFVDKFVITESLLESFEIEVGCFLLLSDGGGFGIIV